MLTHLKPLGSNKAALHLLPQRMPTLDQICYLAGGSRNFEGSLPVFPVPLPVGLNFLLFLDMEALGFECAPAPLLGGPEHLFQNLICLPAVLFAQESITKMNVAVCCISSAASGFSHSSSCVSKGALKVDESLQSCLGGDLLWLLFLRPD